MSADSASSTVLPLLQTQVPEVSRSGKQKSFKKLKIPPPKKKNLQHNFFFFSKKFVLIPINPPKFANTIKLKFKMN
jgi:hypothetical protein